MHRLVSASSDFVPMHEPQLFIYSFRYSPRSMQEKEGEELDIWLDTLNQKIADEIMATGFAFIMTSKIKGRIVLRLSICSHRTTLEDMEAVFDRLQEIGKRMTGNQ
jgi:glutamate/tyrosine decarboxylase-like PLP-dependent enzyme